jgi:hypothetical protein
VTPSPHLRAASVPRCAERGSPVVVAPLCRKGVALRSRPLAQPAAHAVAADSMRRHKKSTTAMITGATMLLMARVQHDAATVRCAIVAAAATPAARAFKKCRIFRRALAVLRATQSPMACVLRAGI